MTALSCSRAPSGSAAPTPPEDRPVAPALSVARPESNLNISDLAKTLAAGTSIPVKLKTVLDTSVPSASFAVGEVVGDVKGSDGRIALPAGSAVTLALRDMNKTGAISVLNISIYTVNVLGKQIGFSDGRTEAAQLSFTEDAGQGSTHTSVHLQYGRVLDFKTNRSVQIQ